MKLSEYVASFIAEELGLRHVFLIVGGANMHLVDSIAKNPNLTYVSVQHEQAGAMAADGYARVRNDLAVTLVTSGPGGTNALTGLCCAWMDSTPCIFISGQVSTWDYTDGKTIRQLGVQQINIVDIVRSVTKYACLVTDPNTIKYHLQKATDLARSGRPGPVWLDIPQNVQMAQVDPNTLPSWRSEKPHEGSDDLDSQFPTIVNLLTEARRPVLIAGNGIRLANARAEFDRLLEHLPFPVVTTWNGLDLVPEDHPAYVGRSGVFGQYGANFAVANADLIFSIGSRLDSRQVGTNRKTFARGAKKIVVDSSLHELSKGLIDIDVPIHADCLAFLTGLNHRLSSFTGRDIASWRQQCREWKEKYPVTRPEYFKETGYVNSYVFVEVLCRELEANDVIVTDMGTSLTCTHQAFKVKRGQRVFTSTGLAPMGYGLPAAIGAWFGSGRDRVICLHGDGGLQMNIQEFQTLAHYGIPLKLFILNNQEYVTIKHTQRAYFEGRFVAADRASGYSTPDFVKVATAYGLQTEVINDHTNIEAKIRGVLNAPGCVVCDVRMRPEQPLIPILLQHKRSDGTVVTDPIERLSPYLPESEFRSNMLVDPLRD